MKKYIKAIYLIALIVLALPFDGEAQNFTFDKTNCDSFYVSTDTMDGTITVYMETSEMPKGIENIKSGIMSYNFTDLHGYKVKTSSLNLVLSGRIIQGVDKLIIPMKYSTKGPVKFKHDKKDKSYPDSEQKDFEMPCLKLF